MNVVALQDVCRITNGGTPKSGVEELWHGGVAWLTPAEMGKRLTPYIRQTARTISREGLANSSAKLVPPGSVILSTRAPIGHLAINEAPMAFNQGCRGLTPGDMLDTSYLYYFLYFSRDALDGLGTGTTFKELSSSNLANFQIPLPPLDEQRRIVAVLDKAFAGIATATANAHKNLINARALFESYLESSFAECAVSEESHKLSDIMEISHGFAFKGEDFSKSDDESRPIVLTPGNYTQNAELDFSPSRTKRLANLPPKAFQFKEGDLTVVMTDLSSKMKILGKPAFIDRPDVLHNQRIGRVIFKTDMVDARLVYHFLRSEVSLRRIRETATGTMVRHTAPSRILSNVIPVPKLAIDQSTMVARLDDVDEDVLNLEVLYRRKLTALTDLKQSLLHKAFAGELT